MVRRVITICSLVGLIVLEIGAGAPIHAQPKTGVSASPSSSLTLKLIKSFSGPSDLRVALNQVALARMEKPPADVADWREPPEWVLRWMRVYGIDNRGRRTGFSASIMGGDVGDVVEILGKEPSELIVGIFVRRESDKFSGMHGPANLEKMTFDNRTHIANSSGHYSWGELQLARPDGQPVFTLFKYLPHAFSRPLIIVCSTECIGDAERLLASIEQHSPTPSRSATNTQASQPPNTTLLRTPASESIPGVAEGRIIIIEPDGRPTQRRLEARLTRQCSDRRVSGQRRIVAGLDTRLDLPADIGKATTACIAINFAENRNRDVFCQQILVGLDHQVSAALFDIPGPFSCPREVERVVIRFFVRSAAEANTAALGTSTDWDPGISWGRQIALDQMRLFEPQFSIGGMSIKDDTIEASSNFLDDLANPEGKAAAILSHISPGTNAQGRYQPRGVILRKEGNNRILEIRMNETFLRLGSLRLMLTNSDGAFEKNCDPRLEIPAQAQLLSQHFWNRLDQGVRGQTFDGERVRFQVNPSQGYYTVDARIAEFPLDWPPGADRAVRLSFIDNICGAETKILKLDRSAFLGQLTREVVRVAPPAFYVIATRSPRENEKIGLRPMIEADFWITAFRMVGDIARVSPSTSRFERAIMIASQGLEHKQLRSWVQSSQPLLGEPSEAAERANEFITLTSKLPQPIEPFNFLDELQTTMENLSQNRASDSLQSLKSPNARVLILGPRLGLRKPVCQDLKSGEAANLVKWLRAGGARVVFVEVSDLKQKDAMQGLELVSGQEQLADLRQCKLDGDLREVALSLVVSPDGLVTGKREELFKRISQLSSQFFGIEQGK
jgi:hypothetical protein